jgi:hypothetical protein
MMVCCGKITAEPGTLTELGLQLFGFLASDDGNFQDLLSDVSMLPEKHQVGVTGGGGTLCFRS